MFSADKIFSLLPVSEAKFLCVLFISTLFPCSSHQIFFNQCDLARNALLAAGCCLSGLCWEPESAVPLGRVNAGELFLARVQRVHAAVCVYTSPVRSANNAESRNVFFGAEQALSWNESYSSGNA